ncbi:MAG: hypothetical protein V2A74_00455 [bacterium]
MTSRKIAIVLAAIIMNIGAIAIRGQLFDDVLLTPEARQRLTPAAAEAYQKAVDNLDHIDYGGAIENLAKAAQAAPRHEELQFLTVKFAIQRARVTYAEDSLKYYAIAEAAIQRILDFPRLNDEDRLRVQVNLEVVRNEKARVYERDSKRNTVGKIIIDERVKVMFPETAITPEATAAPEPTATPPVYATPYPQPGQAGYQQPNAPAQEYIAGEGGAVAPPPSAAGAPAPETTPPSGPPPEK